jgi:hypothetical protein
MSERLPPIMLEALYGDDFEHDALDKLVRIARSYIELALADGGSVAERSRDMAAAVELLEVAGEEILRNHEAPLAEPWSFGRLEGRRAAAMVLGSVERPGGLPDLMAMDLSLHVGDPADSSTEPVRSTYERQRIELKVEGDCIFNVSEAEFEDLPLGRYTHVGLWSGSRLIAGFELGRHAVIPEGDSLSIASGSLKLRVR